MDKHDQMTMTAVRGEDFGGRGGQSSFDPSAAIRLGLTREGIQQKTKQGIQCGVWNRGCDLELLVSLVHEVGAQGSFTAGQLLLGPLGYCHAPTLLQPPCFFITASKTTDMIEVLP